MTRPEIWLCRHGETEWSRDGRHTSRTDLPLTPAGREQARRLTTRLSGVAFDLVLTSPRRRSVDTAALAGFPDAIVEAAAEEWDYGEGEGRTTKSIRAEIPGWTVWTHLLPGAETPEHVGARADKVIERVHAEAPTRALLFSHAHFLRILAARWIELAATEGVRLLLETASVSVLGWEREVRAVKRWNTT
ncbi:MAG: histidine phosphatase family protein [Candidatus Limnocylindrales bacterium]